ncbi:MAG: hypothetical protein AAF502_19740 [Bacteroidota bacterium]
MTRGPAVNGGGPTSSYCKAQLRAAIQATSKVLISYNVDLFEVSQGIGRILLLRQRGEGGKPGTLDRKSSHNLRKVRLQVAVFSGVTYFFQNSGFWVS